MDLIRWLAELLARLERYDMAIWPVQALAHMLGFVALFSAIKPNRYSNKIIAGILAFVWIRTGIVFYPAYYASAYALVNVFAVMFAIQGVLFLLYVARSRLSFGFKWDVFSAVGILIITYALIGYPVVHYYFGYALRITPRLGVTPGPGIILAFGAFLLTDKRLPKLLLVVPVLLTLLECLKRSPGYLGDVAVIIAGLVGTLMILSRDVGDAGKEDLE